MIVSVYTSHEQTEQPILIQDAILVTIDEKDGILIVDCAKDDDYGHVYGGTHRFHRDRWAHYAVSGG